MSFEQTLFALCFGRTLLLLERSFRGGSFAITKLVAQKGITFTVATPTEYDSWLNHGLNERFRDSEWRVALSGGEHVADRLVTQFRDMGKVDLRLFNTYGPTETTVIATAMKIHYHTSNAGAGSPMAVGVPLPNYSVYAVDEQLEIVPPGVKGEIFIGGPGVADGYLNSHVTTSERFITDIFATDEAKAKGWSMMHRTGDVGRWTANGALLIEGRMTGDTQVKLRRIRIDLREVEAAIMNEAGSSLSEVVVSVRSSTPESSEFLLAHVVLNPAYQEAEHKSFL
ncbi:hybrid PKS-NRPS biosynthetic cluster [Apiospora aurea]|uniref:Hybrid PKS-NRPS biosynthetic cluster n=1 Tax=Apiospora aurea TaxID=335848 RepID=A0ABR1Q3D5_9PEZI